MIMMRKTVLVIAISAIVSVLGAYAEGGEGGVEAALVVYSDAGQQFSIGHPGPWTRDTSFKGAIKFAGGDDSMTLELVRLQGGMSLAAYAEADAKALASHIPGFRSLGIKASPDIRGSIILGFEATGTSLVTGKAYTAHDERYYIPEPDGRIAVLTMMGPSRNYDREGYRDIALTLKIKK